MKLKSQHMQRRKAQLEAWDKEIREWKALLEHIAPHLRVPCEERLAQLQGKRDEALRHLAELETVPDDVWEELKLGAELVWNRFRTSMSRARAHFRNTRRTPYIVHAPHKNPDDSDRDDRDRLAS